ncbi:hypothetical protein HMPREF0673_02936 [Leyella stercorea DSM 18206]|uniref:Uncharacterized protein n=1 Tax=Leyella stercorea DSM 18206 TaxID=1002367 RepID=G6B205_9BACT|nr:hypothetical protein HMPREF0673_02936 [Leyella stercorea DSM 18206]
MSFGLRIVGQYDYINRAKSMQKSFFSERSPIRSRSQSDWAAFAI